MLICSFEAWTHYACFAPRTWEAALVKLGAASPDGPSADTLFDA